MKFWQLKSLTREDPNLIYNVVTLNSHWSGYKTMYQDIELARKAKDRTVLDSIVNEDFVHEVLSIFQKEFFLSVEGRLRSYRHSSSDTCLSILEAYKRFGADALEEVCEFGSKNITIP